MVAEEDRPLRTVGDVGSLLEDVDDGETGLTLQGQVQAWHQWEMESHMAFVPIAEIGNGVFRPLVGFGKKHAVTVFCVDVSAQAAQFVMGLREVLPIGPLSLMQVGNGVESQAVDTEVQPEIEYFDNRLAYQWVVPVQIRLMREETVPVVGLGLGVPGPIG